MQSVAMIWWWVGVVLCVEVVLVGLALVVIARECMARGLVGRHEQDASMHTLTAAVDHLVAQNNMLVSELNRLRSRRAGDGAKPGSMPRTASSQSLE